MSCISSKKAINSLKFGKILLLSQF
jgi:hypothetical protein